MDNKSLLETLIQTLLSGTILAVFFNFFLKRRTEYIANEVKQAFEKENQTIINQVKQQFEEKSTSFKSNYAWKEKTLAELLGPLYLLFGRTRSAFARYNANNIFIEARVLKESNMKIRDLLFEKAYLIPIDLIEEAQKLITHYDRWLEEFEQLRGENKEIKNAEKFVFVGPKGFPFPRESEKEFLARYKKIWNELYDRRQEVK